MRIANCSGFYGDWLAAAREMVGGAPVDVLCVETTRRLRLPRRDHLVHALLGEGVASTTRPDPQAKGLGECLRSRMVDVPVALLP